MNEAVLPRRIALIDVWRGIALVAMMTYHGAWDIAYLRLIRFDPGGSLPWRLYAHLIAGSFLFLAGVSLVLATRSGFRLEPYLRRLGVIVAAAALVSLATYFVMPEGWVYFGILHQIALASVIALPFLRLPALVTALVAAAVIALPNVVRTEIFAAPWFWWVGLAPVAKTSFDYVPVFPWTGVVLAGVASARFAVASGLDVRLSRWQPQARLSRLLAFGGRHSLAVYLIHQPILYGIFFAVAQFAMPNAAVDGARADCTDRCVASRGDVAGCTAYCRCVFDDLADAGLIQPLMKGTLTEADNERLRGMAMTCTALTLPPQVPATPVPESPASESPAPDTQQTAPAPGE